MTGDEARALLAGALDAIHLTSPAHAQAVADALLTPGGVVDRIAAARAADEVEAAANADIPPDRSMRWVLRDRAAELRAEDRT